MSKDEPKIDLSRVHIAGPRVLVKEHDPETVTAGGILLPDNAQKDRAIARVIAVGDGCEPDLLRTDRNLAVYVNTAARLKVGMDVITSRYALGSFGAAELGDGMHIIQLADVMALVEPENSNGS